MYKFSRNQDKLQAYQREYVQRKRAPGRRKISKAQQALLEEQHSRVHWLMETEGIPKSTFSRCVSPLFSCRFFLNFKQTSRVYTCTLIVRSREADPRRTPDMIEEEEAARDYFEETKETLQLFCLRGWMDHFQKHVEDFVQERLLEAASIMALDTEEEDFVRLHGLRRLVAGAIQEGELARQPEYAATTAKLDGAIVWYGRGYVVQIHLLFSPLTHLPRVNLKKFRQRYGW